MNSASARASAWAASNADGYLEPVAAKNVKPGAARTIAPATQYVCYWPQDSESAAERQFFDLVSLLQMLAPSTWTTQQKVEADELSGAQVTVWSARDARKKSTVGLYLSGKSVGLHIAAAN
jgi:hypothetical protein